MLCDCWERRGYDYCTFCGLAKGEGGAGGRKAEIRKAEKKENIQERHMEEERSVISVLVESEDSEEMR